MLRPENNQVINLTTRYTWSGCVVRTRTHKCICINVHGCNEQHAVPKQKTENSIIRCFDFSVNRIELRPCMLMYSSCLSHVLKTQIFTFLIACKMGNQWTETLIQREWGLIDLNPFHCILLICIFYCRWCIPVQLGCFKRFWFPLTRFVLNSHFFLVRNTACLFITLGGVIASVFLLLWWLVDLVATFQAIFGCEICLYLDISGSHASVTTPRVSEEKCVACLE